MGVISMACPFDDFVSFPVHDLLPVSRGHVKLKEVSCKTVLRCLSYLYLIG